MEVYKMAAISIMLYTPQEIINIVFIKQRWYKFSQFGLRASMAASRSAGLGQFLPVTSLKSPGWPQDPFVSGPEMMEVCHLEVP